MRPLSRLSYEPGALVLAAAVCGAAGFLETSRVTHKHAQKTGRSRAARTSRTANFIKSLYQHCQRHARRWTRAARTRPRATSGGAAACFPEDWARTSSASTMKACSGRSARGYGASGHSTMVSCAWAKSHHEHATTTPPRRDGSTGTTRPASLRASSGPRRRRRPSIDSVDDLEGFSDLKDKDKADLTARVAAWVARKAALDANYRRSARAPAPRVIVDPEAPRRHVSEAARSRRRRLLMMPEQFSGLRAEGAYQKKNGKWVSRMFPGREFDDLDELRAAKKRRK